MTLLEARGLSLAFGRTTVFEDVSLRVDPGETLALIGASGVGKSSLLRVLAGLLPARGSLTYRGAGLTAPTAEITLAFQDARLLPWRSVEANVAFGLRFARSPKLTRREQHTRVDEALERVGLTHARKALPSELSGGMQARAAFARCLARRPRLLLLDEPFAALDELTRRELQQVLRNLDIGVVLSTHDLDEALLLSDRVLLMAGRPAHVARTFVDATREQLVRALEETRRPASLGAQPERGVGAVACATT